MVKLHHYFTVKVYLYQMNHTDFIRKYKSVLSVSTLEVFCSLNRNDIAHSLGSEKRPMKVSTAVEIEKFFDTMLRDWFKVTRIQGTGTALPNPREKGGKHGKG